MAGVTTRDAKGVPLTADDYDNNLETMISLHQGTSEPSPTYACMLWADTQNTLLKMRNTANDGWVTLGALNTNDAFGGISDLVEDTTPQLGGDLSTNSNDILFADNDKAIFGAGSDLQIYHDGSNSIINDNGTGSLKFQYGGTDGVVFDSSGNVGIGTSSPNGNGLLTINAPTNNSPQIVFSENDSAKWLIGHRHDGDHFRFYNLATSSEAMRIDSSGNVGIGTDSPSVPLHVQANASGNALILKGRNAAENAGWLTWTNYAGTTQAGLFATSDNLIIATGSSFTERMRIDSSGNLLVGKTSSGIGTAGFEVSQAGYFYATRNGNSMALNRLTTDGDIAVFKKDGTTVGSISTALGDLTIGTGVTTLKYVDALDCIHPNGANTGSDGNTTLGWTNNRFKDLYLSGGVYLGGTGSANKLDDYEEGTWTPTIQGNGGASGQVYSTQSGNYIKIGNFIYLTFDVELSTAGTLSGTHVLLGGLPFTMLSFNKGGTLSVGYFSGWQNLPSGFGGSITSYTGGDSCYLMTPTETSGWDYILIGDNQVTNSSRLIGSFVGYVA
jgi:hypothetical protein